EAQEHERNEQQQEPNQQNATSTPNKRSIAQRARRDHKQIKRARIQIGNTISGQSQNNNIRHYIGRMNSECTQCKALPWLDERFTVSSRTKPKYGKCCNQGK
ncbi:1987_t:CDS:2, partial [Gigaspora rosea]